MKKIRVSFIVALLITSIDIISAATFRGVVVDQITGEPLLGATVMVKGSTIGTSTSFDGTFEIKASNDEQLVVSYISYVTQELEMQRGVNDLNISLAPDTQVLASVQIVTRANLETEANLQQTRMASNVAIENIGFREMSLKGLSNAEDGVKKMTGISVASAGQVIVRGLGDRYSLTTMNGVPVASPNPDNKLIPLDVFPSSAIQNITVTKVYGVDSFADYSGALIDIATRNLVSENFLNVSLSIGANSNTTAQKFLVSDRGSLFSTPKVPSQIRGMLKSEYLNYMSSATADPFESDFSISERTALPDFGAQLGFGRKIELGGNKLDLLFSASLSNDNNSIMDAFIKSINATGVTRQNYNYDSYTSTLDISGLFALGYSFGDNRLNLTSFYSRAAESEYTYRWGRSSEGDYDTQYCSNSSLSIYSLLTNQLNGEHKLSDRFNLDWTLSYGITTSDQPDRRQMMFYESGDKYRIISNNAQDINRYFGDLDESELTADVKFKYSFAESGNIRLGGAYRSKAREYGSAMYLYDLEGGYSPSFDNVFDVSGAITIEKMLGDANSADGYVALDLVKDLTDSYSATSDVKAAFVDVDYTFGSMMVNLGVRFENSYQWVETYEDGYSEPTISELTSCELFPAFNLKYSFSDERSLRLSASKSVTRPSFVEMSPFTYVEAYGSTPVRGNGDIENGYNYNIDLRYDFFAKGSSNMFSVCGYYKYLDNPIERVQKDSGGDTEYSFMNSNHGYAAGVEVEYRRALIEGLRLGVNASYIFTEVILDEGGGIYTDLSRELQGASPYLANVDLSYSFSPSENRIFTATLVYALQGPRIDAVGVQGLNNVIQQKSQELNLVCSYSLNKRSSLSLKLENLLNDPTVFTQEVSGVDKELGRFRTGVDASLGYSYKF